MKKFAILAACAALAACGSATKNEDGSVTVKTEGGDVTASQNVALPLGFTLYPGASVTSNGKLGGPSADDYNVIMETADAPDKVIDFYKKQADAAGIKISADSTSGDVHSLLGDGKAGEKFSLTAFPAETGKTSVTLFVEVKKG